MASPIHLLEQTDVIASLGRTVMAGVVPAIKGNKPMLVPGPLFTQIVKPRSNELIDAYIRTVGGSPSGYKGIVPFYMFPQWGFPIMAKTFSSAPWNLTSIMNAGFKASVHGQIPRGEKLYLSARLIRTDITERRVLLTSHLVTGTKAKRRLLDVELTAIVMLPKPKRRLRGVGGGATKPKTENFIPEAAVELGAVKLPAGKGFDFALVSGDINPLHWLKPYAQAFGQKNTILHGFASSAIAVEMINKRRFKGRTGLIDGVDVRFTKPVQLPGGFKVYTDEQGGLYAGNAPGGDTVLAGNFSYKEEEL